MLFSFVLEFTINLLYLLNSLGTALTIDTWRRKQYQLGAATIPQWTMILTGRKGLNEKKKYDTEKRKIGKEHDRGGKSENKFEVRWLIVLIKESCFVKELSLRLTLKMGKDGGSWLAQRAHDSSSWGCEFEVHAGCRDYLNKWLKINK